MNKSELHLAAAKWQHVATLEGSSTCFGHATDLRSAFWINTLATHTWPATRHLILNVNKCKQYKKTVTFRKGLLLVIPSRLLNEFC